MHRDDVRQLRYEEDACMFSSQYGHDTVESVGVRVQVLCRVLKRAEQFGENTMPEQDKQECTQKTAA